MAALVFKVGTLILKQVAKPMANRFQAYVMSHPVLLEVYITRGAEGKTGRFFIGDMTEEKSVELASKLASEGFVLTLGLGIVVFEYDRQRKKEIVKKEIEAKEKLVLATNARLDREVQDDKRYQVPAPGTSHSSGTEQGEKYVGTLEDAVLHNTNQFHKWHAELESACASEMEEKYKRYADLLHSHLQSSENILGKVDETLHFFDSLLVQHRDVEQRSKMLYSSCEQLVKEKDQLVEFADAVRAKLKFFDEFEAVQSQFQAAQSTPQLDTEQFMALLRKLDDCKTYVATNPQYADSGTYAAKFRQLHARALGALRSKVQAVLKHAAVQVQAAIIEAGANVSVAIEGADSKVEGGDKALPVATPQKRGMGFSSMASALAKYARGGGVGSAAAYGPVSALAEGAEVPLLYVRFRAAAEPQLKGLFKEVEERAQRQEYRRLLEECQLLYSQLVTPFVQQRILERGNLPLPAFTRNGCEHLMRVCQLESQLFEQFFPASKDSTEQLTPLMEPLCTVLYDVLRPLVVQIHEIDELCELVDILKHELVVNNKLLVTVVPNIFINSFGIYIWNSRFRVSVLGDQLSRRGHGSEALKPILGRTLADVQGRLIYRCQAFIKDEVSAYVPSAQDVDFPAKLERAAAEARSLSKALEEGEGSEDAGASNSNGSKANAPSEAAESKALEEGEGSEDAGASTSNGGNAKAPSEAAEHKATDSNSLLYPPLRSTLLCLSKLYRAVDTHTFGGLAHEAVSACTLSIHQASRQVARKSNPLDAQLFMIRHLLLLREHIAPFDVDFMLFMIRHLLLLREHIAPFDVDFMLFMIRHLLFLREHIAPFDVDFMVTDFDLDFSHMRDHMRRVVSGEMSSLFTLSSSNAMVKMLGTGGPRVLQYQIDSKKDLEKQLKGVCESFIMAVTKLAVDPMLSFITKVTAVKVTTGGANVSKAKPLSEQLPAAVDKMRLYLPSPSTHAILFKPVKTNIAEAHVQIATLLQSEYAAEDLAKPAKTNIAEALVQIATLLPSEYTAEDLGKVPLRQAEELTTLLDALC
eukprot:gene8686-34133_t